MSIIKTHATVSFTINGHERRPAIETAIDTEVLSQCVDADEQATYVKSVIWDEIEATYGLKRDQDDVEINVDMSPFQNQGQGQEDLEMPIDAMPNN